MVAPTWWKQPTQRQRVDEGRHTGEVLQWKGHFGWIGPDVHFEHPEALKHGRRVYVNAKDVTSGVVLYGGARVSFLAYCDGDGIGAEEVVLEADADEEPARPPAVVRSGLEASAVAASKRAWGSAIGGIKGGVQRTIEKPAAAGSGGLTPRPQLTTMKGKGKGRGKGKGKGGGAGEGSPVVLMPGPGGGGQTPDRTKTTADGQAGALVWASAEMRGWRPAMEDATCAIMGLTGPLTAHAMFGVFDGHGGAAVSRRVADDLPSEIVSAAAKVQRTERNRYQLQDGGLAGRALQAALPSLDQSIRETGAGQPGFLPASSCGAPIPSDVNNAYALTGSTAVVALLECEGSPEVGRPLRVVVANCGDSRAILCRGGEAVALSEDHKPDDPGEQARIEKAGGFVATVGPCQRIDGWGLNLSRALGDFHYKAREDLPPEEQKVSCMPDIRSCEITEEDEFLFLGCDGVFELHSSQEAITHVRERLLAQDSPSAAVESLVDACCSQDLVETQGRGSDNVSAMVVLLR